MFHKTGGNMQGAASVRQEHTLEDYIKRKEEAYASKCACGDRVANKCPGEWEPGCDLGTNEKYVRVLKEEAPKKKLTFEEWYARQRFENNLAYEAWDYMQMAWHAAQENV